MTEHQTSDVPPPRRPRAMLYLPSLLLLLAAAAWTGFWFFAADKANEAVDVWLAREAAHGRVYACGKRDIAGYPFRIELSCENATARFPADGGPALASAPLFHAVAQVYDPKRVIGELTGPVEITGADGSKAFLSFATARASLRVEGRRFERGSAVFSTPRLVVGETEIGAAREVQLHLRHKPEAAENVYEFAGSLDEGVSPFLDLAPAGKGPVSAEFQVEASGVGDLRPRPTSDRLRAFAEAGGKLKVALARIARGDVAAEAKGEAELDLEGRVDGAFDVTARGLDGLIRDLVGGGKKDLMSTLLGAGASLVGAPAELDGQPARTYRVTLDRSRVMIGPIRVTRLPRLF